MKEITSWHAGEEKPLHQQDPCHVPWENLPGVHLKLHESRVPSILKDLNLFTISVPVLLCVIRTSILLSHLLLGLSYQNPEGTLHCFCLTLLTQCRTNVKRESGYFAMLGLICEAVTLSGLQRKLSWNDFAYSS